MANYLISLKGKTQDDAEIDEINKFLNLLKTEYQMHLEKSARLQMDRRKHNQGTAVLETDVVNRLHNHLEEELPQLIEELQKNVNNTNYRNLVRNIVAYLTSFSCRRGGEVGKIKIEDFNKAKEAKKIILANKAKMATKSADDRKRMEQDLLVNAKNFTFVPFIS